MFRKGHRWNAPISILLAACLCLLPIGALGLVVGDDATFFIEVTGHGRDGQEVALTGPTNACSFAGPVASITITVTWSGAEKGHFSFQGVELEIIGHTIVVFEGESGTESFTFTPWSGTVSFQLIKTLGPLLEFSHASGAIENVVYQPANPGKRDEAEHAEAEQERAAPRQYRIGNCNSWVYLRNDPSTENEPAGKIAKDTPVEPVEAGLGADRCWVKLIYQDTIYYVHERFVVEV